MSKIASFNFARTATRAAALRGDRAPSAREAAVLYEDDSDLANEVEREAEKAAKRLPYFGCRFVSVKGLAALVNSAAAEMNEQGVALPWNIDGMTSTGYNHELGDRKGRRIFAAEADALIGRYARFGGWLRAIARDCDATRRMIKRTQSHRGQGSPATKFDLWEMAARWPSPGKLERQVRAVRDRANAILRGYAGTPRVSHKGVALSLMAHRDVGKAAVIAVAITLGLEANSYRVARESLIAFHEHPVVREDDGVHVRASVYPIYGEETEAGLNEVFPVYYRQEGQVGYYKRGLIVVRGDRTFHVEGSAWRWRNDCANAVEQARKAWLDQDYLREEAERARLAAEAQAKAQEAHRAELVSFLDGSMTGACPLITREDSYQAGNCRPGTEEWVLRRGWRTREFIPGIALIPFLDDDRVERVVYAAMSRRRDDTACAVAA